MKLHAKEEWSLVEQPVERDRSISFDAHAIITQLARTFPPAARVVGLRLVPPRTTSAAFILAVMALLLRDDVIIMPLGHATNKQTTKEDEEEYCDLIVHVHDYGATRTSPSDIVLPVSGTHLVYSLKPITRRQQASCRPPPPDGTRFLLRTSGSTTRQGRLVPLTHAAISSRIQASLALHPWLPHDVGAIRTSVTFVDSILEYLVPAMSGGKCVVLSTSLDSLNARHLAHLIVSSHVTRLIAVPTLWQLLIHSLASSRLRVAVSSGEVLSTRLAQHMVDTFPVDCAVYNVYGSTETVADCSIVHVQTALQLKLIRESIPIVLDASSLLPGFSIDLLHESGLLVVSGPNLSPGYYPDTSNVVPWEEASMMAPCFTRRPGSDELCFLPGDIGRRRGEMIEVVGRCGVVVNARGGIRMDLASLLREAVVIKGGEVYMVHRQTTTALLSSSSETHVDVYVLCSDESFESLVDSIQRRLTATLDRHPLRLTLAPITKCPMDPVTSKSMPRLLPPAVSLPQAVTLSFPNASQSLFSSHDAPQESHVMALVLAALPTPFALEPTTNFFQAGLDSIGAAQLVAALPMASLDLLTSHPTVRSLTKALANESNESKRPRLSPPPPMTDARDAVRVKWRHLLLDCVDAVPLLHEASVIAVSHGGSVVKLNVESGRVVWETIVPNARITARPIIVSDSLLIATHQGDVLVLNAQTGKMQQRVHHVGSSFHADCFLHHGQAMAIAQDGTLVRLEHKNENDVLVVHAALVPPTVSVTPVVLGSHLIIVSTQGLVSLLNEELVVVKQLSLGHGSVCLTRPLLLPSDALVLVATVHGQLHRLDATLDRVESSAIVLANDPVLVDPVRLDDARVLVVGQRGNVAVVRLDNLERIATGHLPPRDNPHDAHVVAVHCLDPYYVHILYSDGAMLLGALVVNDASRVVTLRVDASLHVGAPTLSRGLLLPGANLLLGARDNHLYSLHLSI